MFSRFLWNWTKDTYVFAFEAIYLAIINLSSKNESIWHTVLLTFCSYVEHAVQENCTLQKKKGDKYPSWLAILDSGMIPMFKDKILFFGTTPL